MSWISATDPLVLLGIQAGQINTPTSKDSVRVYSTNELENSQRFIEPGEAVPIVFARFRNNAGGILISPGASEARFQNDLDNEVMCFYVLPISEGVIQSVPVKDVFQGACRVGAHSQAFNARAGTWPPGNYLIQRYDYADPFNPVPYELPEAPYFCGSVGLYPNITTISYQSRSYPNGSDRYKRQINIYIRGGMHVTRLYDNVYGPSDNFADLVKWLLSNTARIPSAMIDNAALVKAAQFLEYNGFACNCELKNSTNYADFISKWAPYFLLGESNNGGKKGLRPLLPTTPAGAIDTSPITPVYTFTEDTILPNTLEIDYTSLSDRLPFVAQMLWRQQLESEIGIKRTIEVQYTGTPEEGPYELHDLSEFCTNENHAVKVGAYIIARRTYPTHVIRFAARPQAHNTTVTVGDIIYVYLQRQATNYVASAHAYMYQVERIGKTLAGDVTYEAVHFPVDSQNRSLIALDVAAATGTGLLFPSVRTGVECDENASNNNTIPPSTSISPGDVNDPALGGTDSAIAASVKVVSNGGTSGGGGGGGGNPDDDLDNDLPPIRGIDPNGNGLAGKSLTVDTPCSVQWLRNGSPISGATSNSYTPTGDDVGKNVAPQITCPGGAPQTLGSIPIYQIMPQFNNGGISATVTIQWKGDANFFDCATGLETFPPAGIPQSGSATRSVAGAKEIAVHTYDTINNVLLAPTILWNIVCNDTAASVRRNTRLVTTATNGTVTIGDFIVSHAGNYITNDRKELFHSGVITSIVLTQNSAYGNVGDEVLDLGLLEAVSNGADYWSIGQTISQP